MGANVKYHLPVRCTPTFYIAPRPTPTPLDSRPPTFARSSHGQYCTWIPRHCLTISMVKALHQTPATTPACLRPGAPGALARRATSTVCPVGYSAPLQRTHRARARLLHPTLGISLVTELGKALPLLLLQELEIGTEKSHRYRDRRTWLQA